MPELGETLVVEETWDRKSPHAHAIGTVSRVGRSLFDVSIPVEWGRADFVVTFRAETWREKVDIGTGRMAYTPDEYAELPEREAMLARLRRWVRFDDLTTEQLRQVVAIMDEGGALMPAP